MHIYLKKEETWAKEIGNYIVQVQMLFIFIFVILQSELQCGYCLPTKASVINWLHRFVF